MRVLITLGLLASYAAAVTIDSQGRYATKYDHYDVERILNHKRLVMYYAMCLTGKGPCPPQGTEFKRILPEALKTNCARCTEKQKLTGYYAIRRLRKEFPKIWSELEAEWDPTGEYVRAFEVSRMSSTLKPSHTINDNEISTGKGSSPKYDPIKRETTTIQPKPQTNLPFTMFTVPLDGVVSKVTATTSKPTTKDDYEDLLPLLPFPMPSKTPTLSNTFISKPTTNYDDKDLLPLIPSKVLTPSETFVLKAPTKPKPITDTDKKDLSSLIPFPATPKTPAPSNTLPSKTTTKPKRQQTNDDDEEDLLPLTPLNTFVPQVTTTKPKPTTKDDGEDLLPLLPFPVPTSSPKSTTDTDEEDLLPLLPHSVPSMTFVPKATAKPKPTTDGDSGEEDLLPLVPFPVPPETPRPGVFIKFPGILRPEVGLKLAGNWIESIGNIGTKVIKTGARIADMVFTRVQATLGKKREDQ